MSSSGGVLCTCLLGINRGQMTTIPNIAHNLTRRLRKADVCVIDFSHAARAGTGEEQYDTNIQQ